MFKVLKYMLLANLYKRAKKNFFILIGSVVSLILINLIMNDAIGIASGQSVYILLIIKWLSTLLLIYLIAFSILKIINVAATTFTIDKKNTNEVYLDTKKDRILNKDILSTKSDLILQKYMKDK